MRSRGSLLGQWSRRLSVIDTSVASRPVEVTGLSGLHASRRCQHNATRSGPPDRVGELTCPSAARYMQVSNSHRRRGLAAWRRRVSVRACDSVLPPVRVLTGSEIQCNLPIPKLVRGSVRGTASPTSLRLRIACPGCADQFADLHRGKTTIGSSPRCHVRIVRPGVHPVHLLIVRGRGRTGCSPFGRRCSAQRQDVRRGATSGGDQLSVGPAIIEVTCATPLPAADLSPAEDTLEVAERQLAAARCARRRGTLMSSRQSKQPMEKRAASAQLEANAARTGRAIERAPVEAHRFKRHARNHRRKLRAAVRQNRNECRRLAERRRGRGVSFCTRPSPCGIEPQVFAEHERSPIAERADRPAARGRPSRQS